MFYEQASKTRRERELGERETELTHTRIYFIVNSIMKNENDFPSLCLYFARLDASVVQLLDFPPFVQCTGRNGIA